MPINNSKHVSESLRDSRKVFGNSNSLHGCIPHVRISGLSRTTRTTLFLLTLNFNLAICNVRFSMFIVTIFVARRINLVYIGDCFCEITERLALILANNGAELMIDIAVLLQKRRDVNHISRNC